MIKTFKGFTLTELMVAVMLLGVIAAFGIPNYNRGLQKANEKEAVGNLRVIAEALELYKFHNTIYPDFDLLQVADINTTLNLGIVEENMDYECLEAAPDMACTAASSGAWDIIHDTARAANTNPYCANANCPTIAQNADYFGMF